MGEQITQTSVIDHFSECGFIKSHFFLSLDQLPFEQFFWNEVLSQKKQLQEVSLESWSPWKTTLIPHLNNQYFACFFQAEMSSFEKTIMVFIEVKALLEENKIKTFLLLAVNEFLT